MPFQVLESGPRGLTEERRAVVLSVRKDSNTVVYGLYKNIGFRDDPANRAQHLVMISAQPKVDGFRSPSLFLQSPPLSRLPDITVLGQDDKNSIAQTLTKDPF